MENIINNQEAAPERKKRILSCIQSSGMPTLGNYLGALKNWKLLSEEFDCAFAVADLHAITVRQDPAKLLCAIRELEKAITYLKSNVSVAAVCANLQWTLL